MPTLLSSGRFALLVVLAATAATAQTERPPLTVAEFDWLGTPAFSFRSIVGTDVNESGEVVTTLSDLFDLFARHAGLNRGTGWVVQEANTAFTAINDAGEIGRFEVFTSPVIWSRAQRNGEPAPHGDEASTSVAAINASGALVGTRRNVGFGPANDQAFVWDDDGFRLLTGLAPDSRGVAILDDGTVLTRYRENNAVGEDRYQITRPDGSIETLPLFETSTSVTDMNELEHLTGRMRNETGSLDVGFFWDGVTAHPLPMPPRGSGFTVGLGLNGFDQVVGYDPPAASGGDCRASPDGCRMAVLWEDGVAHSLSALAEPLAGAGARLETAFAITDNGWISGTGRRPGSTTLEVFRMRLGVPFRAVEVQDVNKFGGPVWGLAGVTVSLLDASGATVSTVQSGPGGRAPLPSEDLDEAATYTLVLDNGTLHREYAGVTLDDLTDRTFRLPVTLRAASVPPLAALTSTSLLVVPYSTTQVADLLAEWDASGAETAATWDDRDEAFGRLVAAAAALADTYAGTQPLADEAASVTVTAVMSALAFRKAIGDVRKLAETAITAAADNVVERAGLFAVGLMLQAAEFGAGKIQESVVSGLQGVVPSEIAGVVNAAAGAAVKGGTNGLEGGRWDQAEGRKAFVTQLVASLTAAVGGTVLGSYYVNETDLDFRLAAARSQALFGDGDVGTGSAAAQDLAAAIVADNDVAINASQAVRATAEGWNTAADVSLLVGRIPVAQIAAVLGGAIKGLNVAGLVAVGAFDYVTLHDALVATPDVVARPYLDLGGGGGGGDLIAQFGPVLRTPPGPAADAYVAALEAFDTALAGGDADAIRTAGEALLDAGAELDLELTQALQRLSALAGPAAGRPAFADASRVATGRAGILAGEQLTLAGATLGVLVPALAADPDGPSPDLPAEYAAFDGAFAAPDSARAAVPRVRAALDALEAALDAAFAEADGLGAPATVAVLAHGPGGGRTVAAGVPFSLAATVANVGDATAAGVTVRLVADGDTLGAPRPVLHVLTGDATLGDLAPGERRAMAWTVVAQDTSAAGTAGVYEVVIETDVDTRGAIGALTVDGPETTLDLTLTGGEGWRMLAPALQGQTYDDLVGPLWTQGLPGTDAPHGPLTLYRYDEATGGPLDDGFVPLGDVTAAAPLGTGFFVYVFADDDPRTPAVDGFPKTIPQAGARLTDPLAFPLSFTPTDPGDPGATAGDDGWNLLGNPFDATLSWDLLDRAAVEDAVYVFDPALPGYRVWANGVGDLADGGIAANQAFWAKATGAGAALSAPLTARAAATSFLGRQSVPLALAVEATAPLAGAPRTARAWLALDENAAPGHDARDAFALDALAPDHLALAFVAADGTAHAIDARPAESVEVPVVLDAVTGSAEPVAVTLRWDGLDALPADWQVALVNGGVEHDLRASPTVTVTVTPGAERARPAGLAARTTARAPRLVLRLSAGATPLAPSPEAFALDAPAPNPTARRAAVRYTLSEAGPVRLALYDVLGREVAVLADGDAVAGAHVLTLDAAPLAAGVYVLRLQAGTRVAVRTLTLVR